MSHHTDDKICQLCEEKLATAHSYLVAWFHAVKFKYPNTHVSWAYRDQIEQEQFFKDKRTNRHFPDSPHNHMEGNKPCSLALDLFQVDEDGVARFSPMFYARLNGENTLNHEPIVWGGSPNFKTLGDYDHFQLEIQKIKPKVDAA